MRALNRLGAATGSFMPALAPAGAAVVVAAALLAGAVGGFMPASPVLADGGEAGLVIEHGDGTVETYCVTFPGSSISGEDLLKAASVTFEQVSGFVCTVGDMPGEGCPEASTLSSCSCHCPSGGDSCSYWSYFTKDYGGLWTYSVSGFTAQRSKDGAMQAWRWGAGGPSSAPPPAELSFEQVCGHSPGDSNSRPEPVPGAGTEPPAPTVGPTFATTNGAAVTGEGPSPAASSGANGESGGASLALIAFLAAAVVLAGAIAAAAAWRRRHGI